MKNGGSTLLNRTGGAGKKRENEKNPSSKNEKTKEKVLGKSCMEEGQVWTRGIRGGGETV